MVGAVRSRLRGDLDAALRLEEENAAAQRTPEQRNYLRQQLTQFWDAMDRMFALARNGKEDEAREQIRLSLQAREAALSTAVSRLLVENNEGEQQAAAQIERDLQRACSGRCILFLAATLVAIVFTSLYLIRTNKEIFARLAALSEQRSELAQKLISTQESTLRHISRELHDEFGQVLTAIGSLLGRLGNQAPEGSPLRAGLAGSARNRAIDAEQYPRTIASAASGAAGGARTGEYAGLVHSNGVAPDGAFVAL